MAATVDGGSKRRPKLSPDHTNLPEAPRFKQRYEQVADRLLSEIAAGRFAQGERLPAERELAQRYDVGRASVREALGFLAVRGVVETRPGAGSFVLGPAPPAGDASVADADPDAGPAALLQARAMVEPAVARLAAARATDDPELAALLGVMAASSDAADPQQRRRWSDADRAFHRRIAQLTGNLVLVAIADHIATVMDQPLWQRLRDDAIATPGRTTLQLAEHRLIAAAIAEGDGDGAELLAARHIDHVRRAMALD
ncbi:MAG TPA: FCD domain-containing protein [Baekduia sp.]|jgi:DNA-binding FadR family transcriptional regulator